MRLYQLNKFAKSTALFGIIFVLYACGGESANNGQSVTDLSFQSANTSSGQAPINKLNRQFTSKAVFGRTDGETSLEPTKEQLRRDALSLAKFNKLNEEQADVAGFIIKFKNSENAIGSELMSAAQTQIKLQTQVNQINSVSLKHGMTFQMQSTSVGDASVFSSSEAMSHQTASNIASEIQNSNSNIEYVEPDLNVKLSSAYPSTTETSNLWAIKSANQFGIQADQAWQKSTGNGIVIAVLDTGYIPHQDLNSQYVKNGNVVAGYDFISQKKMANDGNSGRDSDPTDTGDWCGKDPSSWHGTHVAGIIAAASNGVGVTGVAYNAKILPVRVLGRCGGLLSDVASAIIWASGAPVKGVPNNPNPAKVINLSLGATSKTCSKTMANAINIARSRGAVVVVAAGNDSMNVKYSTPANCSAAVTVGSTDKRGDMSWWSNYGSLIDLSAPGEEIYSTNNTGVQSLGADSYSYSSGTSMAAPHVASLYALAFQLNQTLSLKELDLVVQLTTNHFSNDNAYTDFGGAGVANANLLVNSLTKVKIWKNKGDYDADGYSDLLWRNQKTGETKLSNVFASSLSTNNIFISPDAVPYLDTAFRVETTADFTGDGRTDILWRNPYSGVTTVSNMVGRWGTGHNNLMSSSMPQVDRSYTVVGSGDIDNDDYADLLWRNQKGDSFLSFMFLGFEAGRTTYFPISADLSNLGAGDFNGDGFNDFIWRNKAGVISIFHISPRIGLWNTVGKPPAKYLPINVGDYNGDRNPDLLMRHSVTGALAIMLFPASGNANIIYSVKGSAVVPKNHTFLSPGDFNADGRDDVMIRNNSTGQITRIIANISGRSAAWSSFNYAEKIDLNLTNKY
jgi:serine protease